MSKVYTPQRNSLPGKVIAYFQANPSEELTMADIAQKYNVSSHGIRACLSQAVEANLLVLARNDVLEFVYGPGRLIDTMAKAPCQADPAAKPIGPLAPALQAPRTGTPTTLEAYGQPIVIENDVPMPINRDVLVKVWDTLLDTLQPRQRSLLPIQAQSSLAKAITRAHNADKGKFRVRMYKDANNLRVWRVA